MRASSKVGNGRGPYRMGESPELAAELQTREAGAEESWQEKETNSRCWDGEGCQEPGGARPGEPSQGQRHTAPGHAWDEGKMCGGRLCWGERGGAESWTPATRRAPGSSGVELRAEGTPATG